MFARLVELQPLLDSAPQAVVGSRPLSSKEIDQVRRDDIRSLPGAYETAAAVLKAMADIEVYDRPDNYVQTLKSRIEAQTDAEVRAAAEQVIEPDALTFVIVGDLAKIETPIRALDLGEVKVIDGVYRCASPGRSTPPAPLEDHAVRYPAVRIEEREMMPARHRPPARCRWERKSVDLPGEPR